MQIGGAFTHRRHVQRQRRDGDLQRHGAVSHTFGGDVASPRSSSTTAWPPTGRSTTARGRPRRQSGYGNTLTLQRAGVHHQVPRDHLLPTRRGVHRQRLRAPRRRRRRRMPAANAAQTISVWLKPVRDLHVRTRWRWADGGSNAVKLGIRSVARWPRGVWEDSRADLAHGPRPPTGTGTTSPSPTMGSTDKLYLDGVARRQHRGSVTTAPRRSAVLGSYDGTTSCCANGSLDDVRDLQPGAHRARGHRARVRASAVDRRRDPHLLRGLHHRPADLVIASAWWRDGGGHGRWELAQLRRRFTRHRRDHAEGRDGTLLTGGQPFADLTVSTGVYTTATGSGCRERREHHRAGRQPRRVLTVGHTASRRQQRARRRHGHGGHRRHQRSASGEELLGPAHRGSERDRAGRLLEARRGAMDTTSATTSAANTARFGERPTWTSAPRAITFDDAAALKLDGTTGSVSLGHHQPPDLDRGSDDQPLVQPRIDHRDAGLRRARRRQPRDQAGAERRRAGGLHLGRHLAHHRHHARRRRLAQRRLQLSTGRTTISTSTAWRSPRPRPPTRARRSPQAVARQLRRLARVLNGSLDDVRVYNTALTAAQIGQLRPGRYAGTGGVATVTQTGTSGWRSPRRPASVSSSTRGTTTPTVRLSPSVPHVTACPAFVNSGTCTSARRS